MHGIGSLIREIAVISFRARNIKKLDKLRTDKFTKIASMHRTLGITSDIPNMSRKKLKK